MTDPRGWINGVRRGGAFVYNNIKLLLRRIKIFAKFVAATVYPE